MKLLNSSWNLLRQYKLPDEYRLTQESLNGYYKAVNEADPSKRLRMLRARNVERNFQVYPPYWYYRAKAAQESGNDSEALSCWDKFAEVWRPVLRNDPYKLEEAKYRVQRLAANSEANREEIRRLLGVIQDNISAGDWSNNLFAGVAHFLMGDKDEGIACVEVNVDFGYEETVSKMILSEMKKGELDAFTLFALKDDLNEIIRKPQAVAKPQTKQAEVKQPKPKKQTSGKRRDLTREEIIEISRKYGLTINDDSDRQTKCYSSYSGGFITDRFIFFYRNNFFWGENTAIIDDLLGRTARELKYSVLRNEWTDVQVQQTFKNFPSEIITMILELKNLE